MHIFTTDHPLSSRETQMPSAAVAAIVALALTPFVLVRLYEFAIRHIGAEAVPFPQPWLALGVGSVVAFSASFVCALPVVCLFRRFTQRPNHALQRTRPSRHCCNRGFPWAGSLSLGR